MPHNRRKLLLLDRDGTLMVDTGYPNDPAAVCLLPGAAEGVRQLAWLGYVPVVVSNQSGLARGKITVDQARAVHQAFVTRFAEASGLMLPCYYCPHGPQDGCDCRKPLTGLLESAARDQGLRNAPAVMIGDKPSDIAAGQEFGARTVWISHGQPYPYFEAQPDLIATDWSLIPDLLLQSENARVHA